MKKLIPIVVLGLAGCQSTLPPVSPKIDAAINAAVQTTNQRIDQVCSGLPFIQFGWSIALAFDKIPVKYANIGSEAIGLIQRNCDNRPGSPEQVYRAIVDAIKTVDKIRVQYKA